MNRLGKKQKAAKHSPVHGIRMTAMDAFHPGACPGNSNGSAGQSFEVKVLVMTSCCCSLVRELKRTA